MAKKENSIITSPLTPVGKFPAKGNMGQGTYNGVDGPGLLKRTGGQPLDEVTFMHPQGTKPGAGNNKRMTD